jgi:hypothetical protein
MEIWKLLVGSVNCNKFQGKNVISPMEYFNKEVSVVDLDRFYGIIILTENTYGNKTSDIRKHFDLI